MDDAAARLSSQTDYPPAPWSLTGEIHAAVFLVPQGDLAAAVPPGFRLVRLAGRCVVGAAWASYRPPGQLAYEELAVGVLVRRGLRLAVTVPWIWVDSPPAQHGGRALWAIPKQLARFGGARQPHYEPRASDAAGPVASSRFALALSLPGRWRAALRLAQPCGVGAVIAPARLEGRLSLGRSDWACAGALAFLAPQRPWLSLRLADARLRLGRVEEALR